MCINSESPEPSINVSILEESKVWKTYVGSDVLAVMIMKSLIFCVVDPCTLVGVHRRFGGK
jgi:hypothetical protein